MRTLITERPFRAAAAVLFTGFIICLIWQNVSPEGVSDLFSRLDFGAAVMALLVYIGVTAVRGLRFIAVGARVSFSAAFEIAAVHAAVLRVMPFRSGELAYAALIKRQGGGGFAEGMASIILLRILDLAAMLPLVALAAAFLVTDSASPFATALLLSTGLAFGVLFFSLKSIFGKLAARLEGGREGSLRAKLAALSRVAVEAYDLPLRDRLRLIALTALLWGLTLVWLYFALTALGVVGTFYQGLTASILGIGGSIVPLSLIGSFGPMEGGIALGLAAIGHSRDMALASALLVSGLTFVCNWTVAIPALGAILLGDRPSGGGAEQRARKTRALLRGVFGALLFSAAGALLLLLKYPYGFETNDQFQYLLLPYRHIFDHFLEGDWFTWRVSHYHVTFSWLIRGLHAVFGVRFPVSVFTLHLLVLMGLCYGVLAIARALGWHWIAAAFAILLIAFVNHLGLGGAIATHGILLPADMALPPFLIGSALWIRRRPLAAGLLLGLAGLLHANYAILVPMVFAVPEVARIVKKREFKETLLLGTGFLALAWPTLLVTLAAFMTADAAPEALDILFKVRSPHHYSPLIVESRELWLIITLAVAGLPVWLNRDETPAFRRGAVLLTALVASQLIAVLGTLLENRILVRLFFWRLSVPLMILLAAGAGEVCVKAVREKRLALVGYALGALALALSYSTKGTIRFSPEVMLSGFGVLVPALLVLAAAAMVGCLVQNTMGRRLSLLFSVAVVMWVVIASVPNLIFSSGRGVDWAFAAAKWRTFHDISTRQVEGDARLSGLYRWIRDNTPETAVFLIPPGTNDFRLKARRGVFVDWKCCPMKGEELLEWRRRMLAAMGTARFPARGYALYRAANRRYHARPLKALLQLARQESLTHILVQGRPRAEIEGLERLTSRDGYTVYRVE